MVHLDVGTSNDRRLRLAGEMAERFKARVIGIAAANIQSTLYFTEGNAAEEVMKQELNWLKSQVADCEAEFQSVLRGLSGRIEWRSAIDWPTDFVARNARAADLIIVGGGTMPPDLSSQINVGDFVLRAGRPVLFAPSDAEPPTLKTVLVAWKDTREARRAINDALPLLHMAGTVVVVELLEPGADQTVAKARVDDVAQWLTRRHIAAASISTKALVGVTGQLSNIAQDEGADIIVAGAYGHTRFQEWLFGGVTRELLSQHRHFVLLSH
jgi:nucleotide-binding universal stress UspA family protein